MIRFKDLKGCYIPFRQALAHHNFKLSDAWENGCEIYFHTVLPSGNSHKQLAIEFGRHTLDRNGQRMSQETTAVALMQCIRTSLDTLDEGMVGSVHYGVAMMTAQETEIECYVVPYGMWVSLTKEDQIEMVKNFHADIGEEIKETKFRWIGDRENYEL